MTGGPHVDVAGYALSTLDPEERAEFEAHLRDCDACRSELAAIAPVARLAAEAPPLPPLPPDLKARTLLAVERAAGRPPERPAGRRRLPHLRLPRLVLPTAAVAALLLTLVLVLGRDDDPGRLEATASLQAPRGNGQAKADIFFTDIGRIVELDTNDLPILPKGEYYELWFVGPNDRPGAPDRISAGTFHPDDRGRSKVSLTAAVEPGEYRRLAVTAEPGDGDPNPTGPDVLKGRSRLRR